MSEQAIAEAAAEFLKHKRVAVAGVSRNGAEHGGNTVYLRLRDRGYEVFAVNPNADQVEGDPCFHSLSEIPGGVEAVVIATHPDVAPAVMQDCVDLGIDHVWMHRAFGQGSLSDDATELGRSNDVQVIPGGCPLMFGDCSDGVHRVMKRMLTWTGAVPRRI